MYLLIRLTGSRMIVGYFPTKLEALLDYDRRVGLPGNRGATVGLYYAPFIKCLGIRVRLPLRRYAK